jgi:outer membrane lipoprotein-sorting protein
VITFQKVTVNQPLPDDQFQLKIPEGTKIQKLP